MGFFDDNEEWKKQRLGKFTASRINDLNQVSKKKGKIFGVTAMNYIREIRGEIVCLESAYDLTGIPSAEHGHMYEGEAIEAFCAETGFHVEHFGNNNPKFFLHPTFPQFSGASPDGMEVNKDFGVEVKCLQWKKHDMCLEIVDNTSFEEIEEDFYGQIQWNMLCSRVHNWKAIFYHPAAKLEEFKLHWLDVTYDQNYIDKTNIRLELAIEELTSGVYGKRFEKYIKS